MKKRVSFKLKLLYATLALGLALICVAWPGIDRAMARGELLWSLSFEREMYAPVQAQALEDAKAGRSPSIWPADSGAKTSLEYITYLVKRGVLKEGDLNIFRRPGAPPITSLKELRPEDINYRFANVSESDPAETLFVVTRGYLGDPPPKRSGWNFFRSDIFKEGFSIFRKGGDGLIYDDLKMYQNSGEIGALPPREPKFLAP